ncbi:MAG: non-canonical purine NTP pyrophosphatase [Candidatus Moranbacteria bacterium]|jgi:XTP/dITP diphosphohydrolase|nr:non-canonical purine NTP pyrophosphatase [Candidatus Moranbacteria bacterium]
MKLLIGTNNKYKLAQYKRVFAEMDLQVEILSLFDVGIEFDVKEDGDNLLENAEKKAREYAELSGFLTVADDTGLFVDTLNGEPGIHAKRWHEGNDNDRCLKLLEKLKNIPPDKRSCKYIGVVAAYDPKEKKLWHTQSEIDGLIVDDLRGNNGFGYDPIFFVKKFGKRFAELNDSEIDSISHRTNGAKEFIKKYLDSVKK